MKLGLINSAWAQAGRDTAWGIRKTKEIGFDTIDIFADPLDIDVRERRLIKRWLDLGFDMAYATNWIASNDILNIRHVIDNSGPADHTLTNY